MSETAPAEPGAQTPSRLRAVGPYLRGYLARNPVAVVVAVVVLAAAAATGSLWNEAGALSWGAGPLATFASGRWWTLFTALVVPDSAVDAVASALLALTVLAYGERLLGSRRTALLLAATGLAGLLVGIGLHAAAWTVTDLRPVVAAEVPVLDPTTPIAGAVMAASAFATTLWRRRLRLVGFALLALFALYAGDADSWYRLTAAAIGLGLGAVLARGRERRSWHRSSTRESRTLLALLVAVVGSGPIVALVSGGGRGPLSLVVDAYTQYDDEVLAQCGTVAASVCDEQVALLMTRGAGPALLAITPLVLLLVAAWGLRQGRRAAWVVAVFVLVASGVLPLVSLADGRLRIDPWVDGSGAEYVLWAIASVVIPLVLAAALVVARARFSVRATPKAAKTVAVAIALAFLVCATTLFVVEAIGKRAFDRDVSFLELLSVTLRRFLPPAFTHPGGSTAFPHSGPALFAYQWIGVLFWIIVVASILWLFRRVQRPDATDEGRYRELLRRGSDTLGFLGTWAGNRHWYSEDGECAVAYRLSGDVALAVADPLAPAGRRLEALRGFTDFCVEHGWIPAFYSVHADTLRDLVELGWRHVPVGVETVMDLPGLTFAGKTWQKVRQPLTRAEREGYTAVWSRWHELTVSQASQVVAIDEEWVADRALPEMGFTLGSLDELRDRDVRLLLAVGPDERIEAVTSWMPSWTDGEITGWTLDFMRRRTDGPNGMMEFLIAKAALQLQEEGATVLSLSGAPLADDPDEAVEGDPAPLRALLRWLAEVLEPAYGFASLFRFKGKFRPRYRSLALAYRDPLQLPGIGAAVGRAYLPDASRREMVALARTAWEGRR
ncbi:bifunctional lysylphosphatidylglycerol flippase/synthetase MprF [Microbacterium sp. 22296]|uniref:bifunctional lysylphosphatidylglycerol flippase/synthetase MprF n=1 Tax=Microbacterium sp. 22296 TaxID=3453903 RepID=UPI003F875E4B